MSAGGAMQDSVSAPMDAVSPVAPVKPNWLSLRARIVWLAMLAVLIPAAAMVVYLLDARDHDLREAERRLSNAARVAGNGLAARVNGTTQLLFGLSQSRALDTSDRDACSAYLAEVLKRYPQYTGILTIKPDGTLHCDSLRTGRALNVSDRGYFRQALSSAEPAYELAFGRLTGIGVLQVALAARDTRDQVKFVLLASVDLKQFARQVAQALPYSNTVAPIFDGKGILVAGYAGPNRDPQAGTDFKDSALFRFVSSANGPDSAELKGLLGFNRVWARAGLPKEWNTGLAMAVGVPVSELAADADQRMRYALMVVAVASLFAFLAAFALSERSIRGPLARIVGRIEKLGRGDLASRFGHPYPRGEIGEVMQAFDRTAATLQAQRELIRRQKEAQERAQAIVRRSETHLRAIFENAAVGIVRVASDGLFLQVNQRFCNMLGYTVEELTSRRIFDVAFGGDAADTGDYIESVFAGKLDLPPLRMRCVNRDGALKWREISATLVRGSAGTADYAIGVIVDIDARKRAEEEAQTLRRELEERVVQRTAELANANKRLESFSYSVSHDLRTPLRAISGFSQILARRHRDSLNEEGRHYMDNVVRASMLMGRIIEDLLNYSRMGRKALHIEPVSMERVVAEVRQQVQARVGEMGAELRVSNNLPVVRGDATLLVQIVMNLIDNALTYCKPGLPPQVELSWRAAEAGDVIFIVADRGIGIPAAQFENIFGVFKRLHSQDEYPGTGIGLATVKQAAEMLGGAVWVESEVGKGSRFLVRLPGISTAGDPAVDAGIAGRIAPAAGAPMDANS